MLKKIIISLIILFTTYPVIFSKVLLTDDNDIVDVSVETKISITGFRVNKGNPECHITIVSSGGRKTVLYDLKLLCKRSLEDKDWYECFIKKIEIPINSMVEINDVDVNIVIARAIRDKYRFFTFKLNPQ